jgi:hypothetical protein
MLLATVACHHGREAEGLAVELYLDQYALGVNDTLTGTIRLTNPSCDSIFVHFANGGGGELLFFDSNGEVDACWPGAYITMPTVLRLGSWCGEDYEFELCPTRWGLLPGAYVVRAKAAEYDWPWTDRVIFLTE